jgi:O-antigen/teichoic acid export membrane protein
LAKISTPIRLLDTLGLNPAVVFTLLTRAWQTVAGAVTLVLIAYFFAPDVQGFYYTFSSLLALQTFVELGLYIVIVNRASHEWSKLRLDDAGAVAGDAAALSRLGSLVRFIARWYTVVSLLFVLGVGIAGHVFFSESRSTNVAWEAPWATVVVLAAIQLWLMPFLSLLEGCNQVVAVNRFRFAQAVVEALAMWLLFAAGAELWVVAGSLAVRVLATLWFLGHGYGRFFRSALQVRSQERIRWREELWPMQWRLAAQLLVNSIAFSLFTPVMFHFYGAEVAGQTGMTLQIIGVVTTMAHAWVETKVPHFGALVVRRDYAELDRIWWQASKLSYGFAVAASLVIWLAVLALDVTGVEFASRILGPLPTALFLIAYGLTHVTHFQGLYLRAHAREPFLMLGVLGGLLIGGLVFVFGSTYGPTGAAASFLAVIAVLIVPVSTVIWIRRRAEWQSQ